MNEDKTSEAGDPILRHQSAAEQDPHDVAHTRNLEDVEAHIEKHIGPIESVFHEIVSDVVHVDILYIKPAPDRPYHVLVTSGMSDLAMTVPEEMRAFDRAELMIALPEDWPINEQAFQDEANYWPIRWLKIVGRLPHEYETWIGYGHTIPNGDPAEPISGTQFVGVMVMPPLWLGNDFFQLEAASGDTVSFYELVPLYDEEMNFKLRNGADALQEKFADKEIGYVVDINRPNVAKKKRWFGR